MDDDDHDMACTLDLSLELGLGGYSPKKEEKQKVNHDIVNHDDEAKGFNMKRSVIEENQHQNGGSTNHTNDKNGSRKKLRLTKEQSAMLEDTFKLHNTINPAQKRALAEQLNLNLRQVEVWFQNRRARTKLKQTEVNCAFLMKCHEKLTEENLKLKKELEELRALKVGAISSPSKAENWTVCSSCKKLLRPNNDEAAISSSTIEI